MPWQQNKRTGEWREVDANGNPVSQAPSGGVVAPNPIMAGQRNRDNARQDALDAQNAAQQQRTYQLQLAKTIADLEKDGKTLDANGNIVPIPGWAPKPEPLTAMERTKALNRFGSGRRLGEIADNLDVKFSQGPGKTKGFFGMGGILDFLPTEGNQAFNQAAQAARGDIAQSLGLIGSQANSPAEAQLWTAPYIPDSGSYDSVAREGIDRLRSQRTSAITTSIQTLGGVPDASGRIHPLGSPEANQILAGLGLNGDLTPLQAPPGQVPNRQAGVTNGVDDRRGVAKGDTRFVPDTEVNNTIASMYASGASHDEISAYAATRGYRVGPPDKAALDYARKNPGWNPYASAGREEKVSLRQKAAASPLGGYAGGASSALTLGLNDELYGAGAAALGGDYTQARDQFQGLKRGVADESPIADFLGNLSGGLLLGPTAAAVGSRVAPGATSGLANMAANNPIKTAALYGAGYGAGQENQNRLGGAMVGGLGGAVGGGLGKYALAPALSKIGGSSAGQRLSNALEPLKAPIRNRLGGQRVMPAQVSPAEATMARNMPEMGQVRSNIADAADMGLPYSLADADPRLQMLAGTVARKSPDARMIAEGALEPRARGQIDRLLQGIDDELAPRTNIEQRGKDLIAAGNMEAAPYYNMARDQTAPVDSEINAILETPAGRDALKRAYQIAQNEGQMGDDFGLTMNEAGDVVQTQAPSFKTLDLTKRGLDSRINEGRNPITGEVDFGGDPVLGSVDTLRKRLVSRLDALNPEYPKGRAAYAKYAKKKDALTAGKAFAAPGVLPRQVENALPRLMDNLDELQRGFATGLGDTAEKVRYSSNPYDAVMGTPAAQQKMAMLFPDKAPRMNRRYELEGQMGKTRYEALGGSPTAQRLAADESLGGALAEQGGNVMGLVSGAPNMGTAAKLGLQGLRFGMGKSAEKKAKDMAPLLFDQNPAGLLTYFDDMASRIAADRAYKQKWQRRGGLFGGASAISGLISKQ